MHRQPHHIRRACTREQRLIAFRVALTSARPLRKVRQLDSQDRCLQRVEPEVGTHPIVLIFLLPAMLPNGAHAAGKLSVARRHKSRVAEGSEILGWKKGEAPKGSDAANWSIA